MRAVSVCLATLCIVACVACVREGATVVAAVDSNDTSDGGSTGAFVIAAPPPAAPTGQCTARLRAAPIDTGDGCTLDERISGGNGTLLYPCSGDGVVEAVFGEHRFVGKVEHGVLLLALSTELDWDDHCHWETQQGIRGTWGREGSKQQPKLVWSYTESPVRGTRCFGACTATAIIAVDEIEKR